jgi:hypothetical protein
MKKPSAIQKATTPAKPKPDSLKGLLTEVRQLIQSARRGVATVVDTFQVMTNFEIGRRIVEHEQKGSKRAAYGSELLKELSARLTEEFGRGFSRSNLEYMRKFFLEWESRVQISQQPIGKLADSEISQQATGKLVPLQIGQSATDQLAILQQPAEKLAASQICQTPSGKSRGPFTLSWTHYVLLLTINVPGRTQLLRGRGYECWMVRAGAEAPEGLLPLRAAGA